ncbi:hypothetical protein [Tahibacter amnicola]|uniref:Uncharacterized protein n=1 Tax=Tahibacter amnicola TaxID=2976241 RepID=A0ABY6B7B8_9GAMM|nr:hypothetical protein [Tahibacter amnicola]UXI65790.1 hypothetical protein N4264_13550 [Tahibacter amnicola]
MPASAIASALLEPAPPVIESQAASPQGASDLREAAQWCYQLRYQHSHAAQDFVQIIASFNIAPPESAGSGVPQRVDLFLTARLIYSGNEESIQALELRRAGNAMWPCATYGPPDTLVDLGSGTGDGDVRTYCFDPAVPAAAFARIGLTWRSLDVASTQNAGAVLAGHRDDGTGSEGAAVLPPAIMPAPVSSPSVSPFNTWSQDFDITDYGDTIQSALDAVLTALCGGSSLGQQIQMQVSYSYPLISPEGPAALATEVPVTVVPTQPITADTSAKLATTLEFWLAKTAPVRTKAQWHIAITLYSQMPYAAEQPLLRINRLVYRLEG